MSGVLVWGFTIFIIILSSTYPTRCCRNLIDPVTSGNENPGEKCQKVAMRDSIVLCHDGPLSPLPDQPTWSIKIFSIDFAEIPWVVRIQCVIAFSVLLQLISKSLGQPMRWRVRDTSSRRCLS